MHVGPLQASTRFYPRFTLPWVRSIGFGLHASDSRPFQSAPLIACGHVAFAAASSLTELASPLICTPWHVIRNGLCNAVAPHMRYDEQVSGSLHSLSGVLFNVPSRYYALSDSQRLYGWKLMPPSFPLRIRGAVLWIPPHRAQCPLRGYHPL